MTYNRKSTRQCLIIGVSILALMPGIASAQTVGDEIIVTAQKREQNIQDVPISMAALSTEKLEDLGIDEIEDFAAYIPNVFVNNFNAQGNTIRIFIRGIGQNDVSATQDPSVGLYIDGVYVGSALGAGMELADLERAEVLRGPQGTLYGRNTTGGAINMISAKPTSDDFYARVDLTAGNLGRFKIRPTVNIPLGEDAAVKLTGLISERDGVVENTGPGADFGLEDREGFRGAFSWNMSDNLSLDYAFDHSTSTDSSRYGQPLNGAGASGTFGGPLGAPFTQPLPPSAWPPIPGLQGLSLLLFPTLSVDYTEPFSSSRKDKVESAREVLRGDTTVDGHTLNLDWAPSDNFSIKSITGIREVDTYQVGEFGITGTSYIDTLLLATNLTFPDGMGGTFTQTVPGNCTAADFSLSHAEKIARNCLAGDPLPGFPVNRSEFTNEIESFSQEFNFVSDHQFANGSDLTVVAGLYYYTDDLTVDNTGNALRPPPPSGSVFTTAENTSKAVYAQGTFTPAGMDKRLHITLGGRYSDDNRKANRVNETSLSFARLGRSDGICLRATFQHTGRIGGCWRFASGSRVCKL